MVFRLYAMAISCTNYSPRSCNTKYIAGERRRSGAEFLVFQVLSGRWPEAELGHSQSRRRAGVIHWLYLLVKSTGDRIYSVLRFWECSGCAALFLIVVCIVCFTLPSRLFAFFDHLVWFVTRLERVPNCINISHPPQLNFFSSTHPHQEISLPPFFLF